MSPDDLRALRKELSCSAKELALTLGIEQDEVLAWEKGERFPTKRFVDAMEAIRTRGSGAVVRAPKPKPRGAAAQPSAPDPLADPAFWALFRKLVAHPELRREALALAERYPDAATQLRTKPSSEG